MLNYIVLLICLLDTVESKLAGERSLHSLQYDKKTAVFSHIAIVTC
jgi:hypothetical protein